MKMSKLTDFERVGTATISPDGRYVAYTLKESGRSSLWMRQIATQSVIQLAPPSEKGYFGTLTFSPDSEYLYFVQEQNNGEYDTFSVPTLGGTPRLLAQDTSSGVGISPDGKNMAFILGHTAPLSQLVVAPTDGSDRRVLLDFVKSNLGENHSAEAPSWSPDGKFIATSTGGPKENALVLVPVIGGEPLVVPFPCDSNPNIKSTIWLPDQKGLLITCGGQIWLQPFPKGAPQRITNDLNGYIDLAMTADGRRFSAMQVERSNTILTGPAADPDRATPIGASQSDGWGIAWTSDGKILSSDSNSQFWLSSPDGRDRVSAFHIEGALFPGTFSLCGGGRFIALNRSSKGQDTVWRADLSGRNLVQLTPGPSDDFPQCSPDGNWIIYHAEEVNGVQRIPITGGSPQTILRRKNVWRAAFSPDGKQIGILFLDGEGDNERFVIGILDSQGRMAKKIELPPGKLPWSGTRWIFRFTPDGQSLVIGMEWADVVNLWYQPISGGKPRQFTHSPDSIVGSRGRRTASVWP